MAHIMNDLLYKGYLLFVENWYTSVELFSYLLVDNTDCIGTFRKDHKRIPNVVTKMLKAKERIMNYEQNTGIILTKWNDREDIIMFSSCVSNETKNVTRAGKPMQIPFIVDVYNQTMGGVYWRDQMLPYEAEHKWLKSGIKSTSSS